MGSDDVRIIPLAHPALGRAYAPLGIRISSFFQRMRESHKTQLRFQSPFTSL
jgi:hypothetical protein